MLLAVEDDSCQLLTEVTTITHHSTNGHQEQL